MHLAFLGRDEITNLPKCVVWTSLISMIIYNQME